MMYANVRSCRAFPINKTSGKPDYNLHSATQLGKLEIRIAIYKSIQKVNFFRQAA